MNDMTIRLIHEIDTAIQVFMEKNRLTLDCKNISVIPARVFPSIPDPELMAKSGGVKCVLEFRAYLMDEPYRSITGLALKESQAKEAFEDTGQ
jgi:hypothetical protein